MKKLFLALSVVVLLASNAMATSYTVIADSHNSFYSDFSITFESTDTTFTLDEYTSFSGVTCGSTFYDDLRALWDLTFADFDFEGESYWLFGVGDTSDRAYVNSNAWNFSLQGPATPIPGAVWLLGSGLVGLVGFRKKMRR